MPTCKITPPEINDPSCRYLEDDIARGLRASLTAVLATALAGEWANYDFLKGVFSLASSQAALYGISWTELIANLSKTPELEGLIQELQEGCQKHLIHCVDQSVPC